GEGMSASTSASTDTNDAAARRVWTGLRVLVLDRNDRRRAVAEELGMSFNRVKALQRIAAQGPLTLRQIAASLIVDAPYATVIVGDLVKRGFVERTENPADRRSKLVHATADGRSAAGRANRIVDTPPEGIGALDPAELDALDRIVATLLAAL